MTRKLQIALLSGLSAAAFAQSNAFTGFAPGNLVVSRSVYAGTASTVAIGQSLPPVCPSTAACGTAKATDSGAYPAAGSANNVWNNNNADGSFGITSPIFLDQVTTLGALVNTYAVPTSMIDTSFSSKSELALNLTADGTAITFMAYVAPANTIDVSNSNTPGVYDPTNPAGGSFYRAVAQVSASGAIQITKTNSYSGNNGRAAVLANGLYYMVGNSNNGSGTPANVTASTGVQMAAPGQSPTTAPVQVGNFSITQVNDPSTGLPYAADKAGKDNNFRGLTIFNNALYCTKGSGSNGINTVYQVTANGGLPTLANAASATFKILPGFPTILAKNAASTMFPFGIWFANANTLYVADEGDGATADAATSKTAGLQKWSLVNGTWQLDYVLQNGLNLGQPYAVAGYPAAINPATDGLRNLTGRVNSDGTVTLWAVTSTVSANGDQGADPNKLVAITDVLANSTAAGAASEQFTTIRSAAYGEVLRGVSLTPTAGAATPASVPSILSAASVSVGSVAPGSLATATGAGFAPVDPGEIIGPYPGSFGGTSVSIVDAAGKTSLAPLVFVSPDQVTFQVPSGVAIGAAQVNVIGASGTQTAANVPVAAVAPSLFTLNGSGLATAIAVRVSAGGAQTVELPYSVSSSGFFVANPINLGAATDQVFLSLYGTGFQSAGTSGVAVTVNGINAPVQYAGPQPSFPGLDQVNVLLPASLAGKGNVNVQLTASGVASNSVQIAIQ